MFYFFNAIICKFFFSLSAAVWLGVRNIVQRALLQTVFEVTAMNRFRGLSGQTPTVTVLDYQRETPIYLHFITSLLRFTVNIWSTFRPFDPIAVSVIANVVTGT